MDKHECYVSFDVARLLKEAGYDWKCPCHWFDGSKGDAALVMPKKPVFYSNIYGDIVREDEDWNHLERLNNNTYQVYSAPTLSVAQRWLREVKGINVQIQSCFDSINSQYNVVVGYDYFLHRIDGKMIILSSDTHYSSYETALKVGIKKALKLILKQTR